MASMTPSRVAAEVILHGSLNLSGKGHWNWDPTMIHTVSNPQERLP